VVLLVKRLLEEWCEDDCTLLYYVSEVLLYAEATIALTIAVWLGFIPESIKLVALLLMVLLPSALTLTVACIMHKIRKLRARGKECPGSVA
jgi:hypothetical protein